MSLGPVPAPRLPAHGRLLAALALGLLVLMAVYWKGPLSAHTHHAANMVNGDAFQDDLPDYGYVWGRWRQGDMPLWNPHQLFGVPIVAVLQCGVFYPGNLLYLLLPVGTAYVLSTMLHMALGGWFAAWYAARRGLGPAAIVAAALLASLGSDVLQRFWLRGFIHTSPWIFACLIALDAVFERPGKRPAIALAAALAMHFLAGWPQATVMAVNLLLLRAGWWFVANRRNMPAPARTLAWFGAAAMVWSLLIAAQLLPTAELLPESARNSRGIPAESLAMSFHYTWSGWFGDLIHATPSVRVKRMYVGCVGLVLLLASWGARGRRREVAFWFGTTLLFAMMLLGNNGPVYPIYRRLPTGSLFREPTRFMYCAHTAACMCVAFGTDAAWRWFRGRTQPNRRAAVGLLIAGLLSAAAAVNLAGNHAAWRALGALEPYGRAVFPWTAWGALALLVCAGYLWRPGRRMLVGTAALLAAIWVADLFYANRNLHKVAVQVPHYWLDEEDLGLHLPDGVAGPRVYIRATWGDFRLPAKWATLTGNAEISDFEIMHVMRKSRFLLFAAAGTPPPFWFYTAGRMNIGHHPAHPELLSLLSVRWMVLRTSEVPGLRAREWPGGLMAPFVDRTTPALRERGLLLAENPDALPRAYVVERAQVIADETASLFALVAPDFDQAADVILAAPLPAAAPTEGEPAPANTATSDIVEYRPERVRIRVDTAAPGYLVLTDAWYPGWRATVNGRRQEIARANVVVRAVAVPAGSSEVVFEFRPTIQYVGIALSLVGLLACVGLWIWPVRERAAPAPALP